ncbi:MULTISPECIES: LysR substrate-binding domain-containing protein [unclassified Pseudomonas]|uniref:LysR substrate-binding domain-containing protein n=1 Tax=unclassified Pseudomonas TaxID=196821 RepID=UPI001CBFF2D3|nr:MULTISPECIES: LysR substrate-binding domain-containing protein [unclassified Pseudomonas]
MSRPPADRTGINGLRRPDRADYISLAQGSGNRFLIDQALANRDMRPRSFWEVKHVPAFVSLVEAGLGVGVVPKFAMPADGHATLVTRLLTNSAISRTAGLISRRGRTLSPIAQLLFDLLMGIGK